MNWRLSPDHRPSLLKMVLLGITAAPIIALAGPDQDLGDFKVFPDDNVWKWDVSGYQVHPNSAGFIASVGASTNLHPDFGTVWQGAPIGIPYLVVTSTQPLIPVVYTDFGDESDPGPFPIPLTAAIEGGAASDGDRHVITVDRDRKILCELYYAFPQTDHWNASSGAKFDLTINQDRTRGWTSADAAGLPIFPGLVRYEEVYVKGEIDHAIRMTVLHSQTAFIYPARHQAGSSSNVNYPPMGLRFRMKAGYDLSRFSPPIQVICRAMKKHGLIVADNGSNWYLSGAPDPRWSDDTLGELRTIPGSAFEAILTVDSLGNPIKPSASISRNSANNNHLSSTGKSARFVNGRWLFSTQDPHVRKIEDGRMFDVQGRLIKSSGIPLRPD
jgi:hypothetical protein